MKTYFSAPLLTLFLSLQISSGLALGADKQAEAADLVERAEQQTLGKTFSGHLTMKINGEGKPRKIEMKLWSIRAESSLVKIITPAKDRDVGYLRNGVNLWQYLPNIERVIKIPTSMMLQSWMGSDFSNDDLVKLSSLSTDYTHSIIGKKKIGSADVTQIECTPKKDAPVVWGKVILWVRTKDAVPVKQEFYSEGGELLKVLEGRDIKTFGTHTLATHLRITTVKKKTSTELVYRNLVFDKEIPKQMFTQEQLKRPL